MKFTVYIIFSKTHNIFYKGVTSDFNKRLFEHNNDLSRFTAGKGPWFAVYTRDFDCKRDALIEEKRIKRLNRTSVLKLINKRD